MKNRLIIFIVILMSFLPLQAQKIKISIQDILSDIYRCESFGDYNVMANACDGLLKTDVFGIKPSIAYYWEVNPQKTVFTFKIRDNVYFHSGQKLTPEDIKKFFEDAIRNNLIITKVYIFSIKGVKEFIKGKKKHIEGIKVLDKNTLQFELNKPEPSFLLFLASVDTYIRKKLPSGDIDCTGPFKIKIIKNTIPQKIILKRNEKYFIKNQTNLKEIELNFGSIIKSKVFKDFHIIKTTKQPNIRNKTDFYVFKTPYSGVSFLVFGNSFWGNNINFRKFVFNTIDKEELSKIDNASQTVPAKNIIPYMFSFFKETIPISQNYEIGIASLRKIKHEDIVKNPVKLIATKYFNRDKRMLLIKNTLEKYGFKTSLTIYDSNKYLQKFWSKDWDLAIVRILPDSFDINDYIYTYFRYHKSSPIFISGAKDLNVLVDLFTEETSFRSKLTTLNLIMKLIENKALLLPLFHQTVYYMVKKEITGLSFNITYGINYRKLKIKNEKSR